MQARKDTPRTRGYIYMLLGAAYLFTVPLQVEARTWRVPAECPTIKAGLDSASSGDTVLVAAGTYVTSLSSETHIEPVSGVALVGEAGRDETIIEICDWYMGMHLEDCEGARVSGFTVRLVVNDSCGPPMDFSYGVHCIQCTDVVIEDCAFENLTHGIYVWGSSEAWYKPVFRNNRIRDCVMGVGCYGVYDAGRPLFEGNAISDCYWGAEIEDSAPDFDDNEIAYCHTGMHYAGHCGGNCARNVIAHNQECGVYVWSDPPLASPWFNGGWALEDANDIYDNGSWDIWYEHTGSDALIMAIHNYWGSWCPDFPSKIHGRVKYSAWVDSTHTILIDEDDCPDATDPATWGSIKGIFR